jgi:glycine/serine hydroxymethyltransferase
MGTDEMSSIATWILRVLKSPQSRSTIDATKREVCELAEQYPVPAAKLEAVER